MPIVITLPFPPVSTNHYLKRGKGRVFRSKEATDYHRTVALLTHNLKPLDGLVAVRLLFYRGERNGRLVRGDVDGFSKVLLDALQGRAYVNDSQIEDLRMTRRVDRENPRVEVRIEPWSE